MRIGPALLVCGALALSACGSTRDVRSTESFSNDAGELLPPVEEIAANTTIPNPPPNPPPNSPTTLPGTRPFDFVSSVLLASDLPGWDVARPMDVPAEPTWEALDCVDMTTAWGATGRAGTRSRGTNGGTTFRNTAVEFATTEEASDVLDAVDRVWTDCPVFETSSGSFWSEPIAMPSSTLRTSGLVIGDDSFAPWALGYWQIDTTVVILEVEGDEMWTNLDPLLATLSARLDGTPSPIDVTASPTIATTPDVEAPVETLPVIVPATPPTIGLPSTTTPTEPQTEIFPPTDDDWTEHRLAHLAPSPDDIGPDWEYQYGNLTYAEPADPGDAIEGCDAPVPPTLDGYDLDYRNTQSDTDIAILVGDGSVAESQVWIDAFRAIAACDLDSQDFTGAFDLVDGTIEGADDSVIIAGEAQFEIDMSYVQVLSAARVDGILVAALIAVPVTDAQTTDATVARVTHLLELMLETR